MVDRHGPCTLDGLGRAIEPERMSLPSTFSASASLNGQAICSGLTTPTTDEGLPLNDEIPAGSAALDINIGIADTSKVKAIMLKNDGAAAITHMTLDGGGVDYALGIGESIHIQGAALCAAFLNAWSGATTMLAIAVTTPAGPAKAKLSGLIVMNS
jgi:hypothetical protein